MSAEITVEVREPKEESKGAKHLINATKMLNVRAHEQAKDDLAKALGGTDPRAMEAAESKLSEAQIALTAKKPVETFDAKTSPLTLADLREEITGLSFSDPRNGPSSWRAPGFPETLSQTRRSVRA